MDTAQALMDFRTSRSQTAFADLVRAHLDMVYAAALRQVRDPGLAEDVTQAVFIIFARRAASIPAAASLAGWLFRTTQYAAANAKRLRAARHRREERAAHMRNTPPTSVPQDPELAALLDRAIARLGRLEHDAIVLKFYQDKPWREVGAALGISEEAARKRVARALDGLRAALPSNAALLSGAAVGAFLTQQAGVSAPAHLLGLVTKTALSTAALATPAGAITKGVLTMMTLQSSKLVVSVVVAGLTLAGAGLVGITLAGSGDAPANPPTATAPATRPAIVYADPLAALRALRDAIKKGDAPAIRELISATTPEQRETVDMQALICAAFAELSEACRNAYGPTEAAKLPNLSASVNVPNNAKVTINGDSAVIEGGPAPFTMVKIDQGWKLAYDMIGLNALPISHTQAMAWQTAQLGMVKALTKEVDDGKLKTMAAVTAEMQRRTVAIAKSIAAPSTPATSTAPAPKP